MAPLWRDLEAIHPLLRHLHLLRHDRLSLLRRLRGAKSQMTMIRLRSRNIAGLRTIRLRIFGPRQLSIASLYVESRLSGTICSSR